MSAIFHAMSNICSLIYLLVHHKEQQLLSVWRSLLPICFHSSCNIFKEKGVRVIICNNDNKLIYFDSSHFTKPSPNGVQSILAPESASLISRNSSSAIGSVKVGVAQGGCGWSVVRRIGVVLSRVDKEEEV